MAKSFIVDKKKHEHKKIEKHSKGHKKLKEFYNEEEMKNTEAQAFEDQFFEHMKKHTKKVLEKK